MAEKKVIAVVVTYNRKELLKECIENLLNQEYEKCNILIVDNCSTDGTKEAIECFIDNKKVFYKNTGENLGGAGGFNFGLREAYNMGGDFMWIMDDDCMVHKDSLKKLIEADEELNGNYGFLSSKVTWINNSICKMNIPSKKLFRPLKDFDSNLQTIVTATFVSLFLKRETIKEFGLPIKEFFIWTDDIEYTRRISKKYKCYFVSSSVVTHKSKNNEGPNIITDSKDRMGRYRYCYRNEGYVYRREGMMGILYYKLKNIYTILKIKISNCEDKKQKIKIILDAEKEQKTFNPPIEYV